MAGMSKIWANKIWANSGDSHFLEPPDLWNQILPAKLAERMPRSEPVGDSKEIVHVDGQSFRRTLPKLMTRKGTDGLTIAELSSRPPGSRDVKARLKDLDDEGVWGEVIYPSLGLWQNMIKDPVLVREATRAENDWILSEIQNVAPDRLVPTGQLSLLSAQDAAAEVGHCAEIGLHAVFLPTGVPDGVDDYHRDSWEPLWSAAEDAGMVIGFHIGTDGGDTASVYRGPGGAVLNYVETTYGGQKAATKLVASGALDRHPNLKILISEGGATWVPFLGDRMNEGYRQHGMFVRPVLSNLPKEILYRQVYASFQHDESAPAALTAMGYQNILWGSDYPHLEGTYGHTQKTLHELFDGVDEAARLRITQGTFLELFPHVAPAP
jgi:predicted TIM-barrel fold metal-dependent hydrolase